MKHYILGLETQINDALRIGRAFAQKTKFKPVKNIILCGVGGSGISGDIIRVILGPRCKLPITSYRGGPWPRWADKNTLVVLSSYSGNTAEILDLWKLSGRAKCQRLVVGSGGKLERLARLGTDPWVQIPSGLPPRTAHGFLTFSVMPTLAKVTKSKISHEEIEEMLREVRKPYENEARKIAKLLHNKSAHFYGALGLLEPVLIRWRAQFAENAKALAAHHFIPEMFHNEIEGWRHPAAIVRDSVAVFFTDRDDLPVFTRKRHEATRIIKGHGGHVLEIASRGKGSLARLFSLMTLGDWTSYELALLNKMNAVEIPMIEAVKAIQ